MWNLFDDTVTIDRLIQPGRTICWGAQWLGEKKFLYADERGGAELMHREIHKLLSQCDALVTYNGAKFDLPRLEGGFLLHGLPPIPPITHIDLYKTVRNMDFTSSKLAFVGPYLKIGEKVKHEGFDLWRKCMDGDEKAWGRMKKYNKMDVVLLEGLYNVLRPHIRNHPYIGSATAKISPECPACGSTATQSRGVRRTRSFLIQRLQCITCGGWFDGTRKKT